MSVGKVHARKPWSRPLADLVGPCLTSALSRFGFSEADLLMFWPEIVGERLASRCEPMRIKWPVRSAGREAFEPATLVVRVEGAFALDLQHRAAAVIERVNVHFGWRCIGCLALRQGPVARSTPPRAAVPPPDLAAVHRARAATEGIDDEPLREALARLGGRVLSGGTVPPDVF